MKKSTLILSIVTIFGAALVILLLWQSLFPPGVSEPPMETFSGNPVTEGTVILDDSPCAQRLTEAERAGTCEERWTQFRQGLSACRDHVIASNEGSFFYEEEMIRIVSCFDADERKDRSLEILKEAQQWGEWKIDHGPTICPGETYTQAAIEVREKAPSGCLKPEDLEDFLRAHVNRRDWVAFLGEALRSPQVVMVGAWETDTHCAAPRTEVQTLLAAAAKDEGEWLASKAPEDETTYFVGMNPPMDFKLALSFALVDECLGLSNIDYNLPGEASSE